MANRILVASLGNHILGDDGVGHHVAKRLKAELKDYPVDVKETQTSWLNAAEEAQGYNTVIFIDSLIADKRGRLCRLSLDELGELDYPSFIHGFSIIAALRLLSKGVSDMPRHLTFYSITIKPPSEYCEGLSKEVADAADRCVEAVKHEVSEIISGNCAHAEPSHAWPAPPTRSHRSTSTSLGVHRDPKPSPKASPWR